MSALNILLILAGAVLGAALAGALARRGAERMRADMRRISDEVLAQAGEALADRVARERRAEQERASGELAMRGEQIRAVVAPVQEKLERMDGEIARLERERRQAQGELAQMVRSLGEGVGSLERETGNLVSALRRPATRGAWGELQLRNVVEMAGMLEHCDFVTQQSVRTGEGTLRPDMLVRLPGGRLVVVDSKVPLDAHLSALEARDEDERALHAARHARQTREHIGKLAAKAYHAQFESSPEFVVMFVPSEGIFQAALEQDPTLIEHGVRERVLIATPTTLIALLWAVHHGWRQELIADSAREISAAARELHARLARFTEPLSRLGRQLDSAAGAYNEAVGSFEHRVIPQARRLEHAGAGSGRALEPPEPVDLSARILSSTPRESGPPSPEPERAGSSGG